MIIWLHQNSGHIGEGAEQFGNLGTWRNLCQAGWFPCSMSELLLLTMMLLFDLFLILYDKDKSVYLLFHCQAEEKAKQSEYGMAEKN